MSLRNIPANNLKKGSYFMDGEEPCQVIDTEHSKSGKHGHAKNRVSCVGLFDKKKRSLVFSSGSMVQVPEILKRSGQVTDINQDSVMVMDLDTYETFTLAWPDEDEEIEIKKLKKLLEDPHDLGESQIEYWDVVGRKIIQRVIVDK